MAWGLSSIPPACPPLYARGGWPMDQRFTTSTTSAKAVSAATQLITVSRTRMVGSPMPGKSGTGDMDIVAWLSNIITRLRSCSKRNRNRNDQGEGGTSSSAWSNVFAAAAADPSPVSDTATKARRSIE